MRGRILRYAVVVLGVLFLVAQFVQPEKTNPSTDPSSTFEAVAKPSPQVASLVQRACYDCHSNSTVWPWYSRIAPVSWLVAADVHEGRRKLNFSQWNLLSAEMSRARLQEACEEVREGKMPPWNYRWMHSKARLTGEEVKALCEAGGPMPDKPERQVQSQ